MRGKKIPYSSAWRFTNSDNPVEFVKMLCDSFDPCDDIYGYGTPEEGNISAVKKHYNSCEDPKLKKKLAEAIVKLMRDDDYKVIAISAASELYLEEALTEFKSLSKQPLEKLRKIKTVYCTNALFCTLNYAQKLFDNSSDFLLTLLSNKLDHFEYVRIIDLISQTNPNFGLANCEEYIKEALKDCNQEQNKLSSIAIIVSNIFKKYGDQYCIDLAKRFKESLSKEHQVLYYKALETNGKKRFHEYLGEVKRILHL